jgi:hypothetical protein
MLVALNILVIGCEPGPFLHRLVTAPDCLEVVIITPAQLPETMALQPATGLLTDYVAITETSPPEAWPIPSNDRCRSTFRKSADHLSPVKNKLGGLTSLMEDSLDL